MLPLAQCTFSLKPPETTAKRSKDAQTFEFHDSFCKEANRAIERRINVIATTIVNQSPGSNEPLKRPRGEVRTEGKFEMATSGSRRRMFRTGPQSQSTPGRSLPIPREKK